MFFTVGPGLIKYRALIRFNMYIIGFSLGMDILIIGRWSSRLSILLLTPKIAMMSLKNSFVYSESSKRVLRLEIHDMVADT